MIKCDKCRSNLSAFIDDETSEQEAIRIKEHLDACPGCQEQVNALKSVRTSLKSLFKIQASPSFDIILRDRIRREMRKHSSRFSPALFPRFRVPAFAAAAVAVLLIGMLIGGTLQQTPPSQLARTGSRRRIANPAKQAY
ncbi:MAG: zf-HC2 domain-containing protein [candidate division KSB1 bacterium]|nr:zf-HC2 domain-containing protein [candidate division KSB1 bacterium]